MTDGLKPCPFCGGKAELFKGKFGFWHVKCGGRPECSVLPLTNSASTESEAIAAWNARAERTCRLIRHGSLANMPSFVCWSCSECGFGWHHSENDKQFSFCPNCGARVIA